MLCWADGSLPGHHPTLTADQMKNNARKDNIRHIGEWRDQENSCKFGICFALRGSLCASDWFANWNAVLLISVSGDNLERNSRRSLSSSSSSWWSIMGQTVESGCAIESVSEETLLFSAIIIRTLSGRGSRTVTDRWTKHCTIAPGWQWFVHYTSFKQHQWTLHRTEFFFFFWRQLFCVVLISKNGRGCCTFPTDSSLDGLLLTSFMDMPN